MKKFILYISILVLMFSCKPNSSYPEEVKVLDSLIQKVEKSEELYETIPVDAVKARLDSIQSMIRFIEESYGGEMEKENGLLLDKYRGTKSLVKRFPERTLQLELEYKRTLSQLLNFKAALTSGATHDKNDKEITPEYVVKNMKLETKAAETLMMNASDLKERSSRFIDLNEEKLQELLPYVNSLK